METSLGETSANDVPSFSGFRSFRLNKFEGPLDLLLFLIKKNEINIYDIPIAEITEQYLEYLASIPAPDLDEISEFHAMAATLLLIKSRMLLPVEIEGDDDDEDPRQELVERLIEYQKYKKLSGLMEQKEREVEWVIERKQLERTLPFNDENMWEKIDVWDLFRIFSEFTAGLTNERIIDLYEEVSINEKIVLLYEIMETRGECSFTDLIVRKGSIPDFVCAFLALLEAVKQGMVLVFQNRMFGDIVIRPSNRNFGDGTINDGIGTDKRNSAD